MVKELQTPISDADIQKLHVGDRIRLSGYIYAGRDAVLPKVVMLVQEKKAEGMNIRLRGSSIFDTAVSPAGVGPTSSNKLEIESSIEPLSEAGVKLHIGKGRLSKETVAALNQNNSAYVVIPPVSALLTSQTSEERVVAYSELGMEAFYRIKISDYEGIIAAVHGKSIYDEE